MNNQLSNVPMKQLVAQDKVQEMFHRALGKKATQFATSLINITNSNQSLAKVDQMSVINSAMVAATLDLPIDQNLGYVYLVPYGGHAQPQIGYKGYIQLAQRSGRYVRLNAIPVYEGELINWNPLTEELSYSPVNGSHKNEDAIGFAGYFKLNNGFEKYVYWTREQMEDHRMQFSKAAGGQTPKKGSPWGDHYNQMARKTVIKSMLTTWGPLSVEMQTAVTSDEITPESNTEIKDVTPDTEEAELNGFAEAGKEATGKRQGDENDGGAEDAKQTDLLDNKPITNPS
ncbi:recombinase RecT [Furfurilactobacillus entadae]|uniref:recombinase RecT n=1 Tax=Furfurilactobacillus entadae TaxID=2922307 RepID=UPI0035E8FF98